jgi:type III pantothenate kinase
MILGFDIGNSVTVAGCYPDDEIVPQIVHRYDTAKDAGSEKIAGEVKRLLDINSISPGEIRGIAASSVVPELIEQYRATARSLFSRDMLEINDRCRLSLSMAYRDPSQLGPDRIANAEAALSEYGTDIVVADLGTAVTFTVVDEKRCLAGGIIAPGVGTAIAALAARASRLPEIRFEKPESLVARDTVNAIKSGFFYGWISMIEGIAARIEREYRRTFRLVLTGGYSNVIAGHMGRPCIHDPDLTMKGIKLIYDLNSGENSR